MGRIRSRFHLQMQQPSRRLTTESLEPRIQLTSVPVISEFQAVNRTTIQDEDGDFSDWIEIWNPSLEAVNLDGWYLTDDSSNLKKWQIPTVAVPAKQQILVFASGKNRANEAELHTNFKLSRDGEYLALVDPNGNVTDDFGPNYPKQVEDQSFGLFISRDSTVLLRDHSPVSAFVPTDNSLGVEWTDVDFQDADWQTGLGGVGFENLRPAFSAREDFESLDNWTIDIPPSSQAIVNSNAGIHFSLQSGENTSTAQRGSAPLVFRDLPAVDARKWEMVAHVEKVKPSDRGSIGIMIYDADTGKPALMLEQSVRRTFHFSTGQLNFDFSKRQDGSFFLRIARDDVEKTWSAYVKVNEFDEWELLGSVRDGDHGVPVIADPKPGVFARTPSGTLDARITTVEFHVGEQIPNFAPDIGLDVTERMAQQNSSIYIRKSFEVDVDPRRFDLLELGARFNDGFKAYLNGVEITSQNAPPMSNWKSSAIETRFPSKNTQRIEIPDLSLLQKGMNILAIHGMSATANDEEFFFNSNLTASTRAGVFNSFPSSPTPGAPNALPNAPSPMLLSDEGVFYGSKTVALQLDETHDNLEIRYTLDGSLPTKESNLFSGPFTIDKSVMLQARTFDTLPLPNFELSNITSGTFISVASELRERTSDIPLMIIDTLEQELPDGTTNFLQAANVGLFDVGAAEQRSSIDNSVIDYLGRGGVRRRGSSTAGSPKPSMAFETWGPNGSQQDDDFDASLLGLAPDSDWILYAPFGYDRTFLRNRLAFELSNQMGMWAAGTRFIEVYFNEEDGVVSEDDYVGVYVLMEKIKQGNHRVDIAEIGPSENSLEKISGGYIWKLDRRDSDALPFRGNINWVYPKSPFSVSARDDQKATLVQQAWVNDFFDAFEATLEDPEINDPDGYSKFIDVQAWIDQNILNAMMWNVDAFNFSAFFHKDRAGKLVYGPVWDFNISSGSLSSGYDNPLVWGPIFFERQWFSELFRDPGFWQQYIDRWHMWRRTVLSDDNINSIISRLFEEVAESAERNSARWLFAGRTFGTFDHFGNLDGSFKGEINHLRDWLATRTSFIDANFPETPLYRLDDQIVHDVERIQVSVGQNVEIVAAPIEVFDATILVSGEPGHTDARYFVPADDELSDLWTLSEFDDSQWKRRPTGYGYDDDDGFDALIGTVVDPRAVKKGATNILLRIPFHISSDIDLESSKLILRMKYNGGYVAHINGVRVRLENISSEIAWDAKVTGRSDDDAIEYHDVDLSRFNEMMVEGENILAIRAINSSARSSDMLVLPELVVRYTRQVNDPETDVFFTID